MVKMEEVIRTTFEYLEESIIKWPEVIRWCVDYTYPRNAGGHQMINNIDCVIEASQWRPEYLIKPLR